MSIFCQPLLILFQLVYVTLAFQRGETHLNPQSKVKQNTFSSVLNLGRGSGQISAVHWTSQEH